MLLVDCSYQHRCGYIIHPIFYVSLLEPYTDSIILGKMPLPAPLIEMNGHEEYEVDQVFESHLRHGKLEYPIKWSNYDIHKCTWELTRNLVKRLYKIHEFH